MAQLALAWPAVAVQEIATTYGEKHGSDVLTNCLRHCGLRVNRNVAKGAIVFNLPDCYRLDDSPRLQHILPDHLHDATSQTVMPTMAIRPRPEQCRE